MTGTDRVVIDYLAFEVTLVGLVRQNGRCQKTALSNTMYNTARNTTRIRKV